VLLVALESTAARYLGLYGDSSDPMPTLTALSQQALVVNNAYAVYPESIKGLFSTLCSRFPAFSTPPETHAEAACESLPSRLSHAGYATALFHSGRFMYLGMDAIIARQGFHTREDAGAIGGNVHSSFGVDEPATVARILSWIDAQPRGRPFFATYMPVAGHHPYATTAPGPFDDANELGRYLNALHEGDAALGTLLKGLRDRGLDRETLIVAYGDHGEAFGQHPGNSGHTLFIYDENIRVPLIIAAPGAIREQVRIDRVARRRTRAPRCWSRAHAWPCSSPTTRSAGLGFETAATSSSTSWTPIDRSCLMCARTRTRPWTWPPVHRRA
jgi:lipoteichoic acid synthase